MTLLAQVISLARAVVNRNRHCQVRSGCALRLCAPAVRSGRCPPTLSEPVQSGDLVALLYSRTSLGQY